MHLVRIIGDQSISGSLARDVDEVVVTEAKEVATDSSDIVGLRRVGKGIVRVQKDTLCGQLLKRRLEE